MVRVRLAVTIVFAFWAIPALACPICDTGTGEQVRAGIFDNAFAWNAFLTALPFIVMAPVLAGLHFGLPGRRSRRDEDGHSHG
jgi:hypothetical protein